LIEWNDKFKDYKTKFSINSIFKQRLHTIIIANGLTISTVRDLIFSENLLTDFIKIWNDKLSAGSEVGGIDLLFMGLRRLFQLQNKGIPHEFSTEILIREMKTDVFYREMQRRDLLEFSAFKGRDLDWTPFEIRIENSYISPLVALGGSLGGLMLLVYCENEWEAATGIIRIKDDNKEVRFISSYQIEGQIHFIKDRINIPLILEYKLDIGSDPVIFTIVGYASITGIVRHGISLSWNILV